MTRFIVDLTLQIEVDAATEEAAKNQALFYLLELGAPPAAIVRRAVSEMGCYAADVTRDPQAAGQ